MNLTPEQSAAVEEIESNLQIVACAGSGKTEVISRRIAHILQSGESITPEQIVAFTFTEKAAESLRTRIERSLPEADKDSVSRMFLGTIHGYCYYLLMRFSTQFSGFHILDTVKKDLFLTRYRSECGVNDWNLTTSLRDLRLFSTCMDKLIDDYDNRSGWAAANQTVFRKYTECLYAHRYLDFSLLIHETILALETNPQLNQYLSSIRYLTVDEYQDVDNLQEKLISAIASKGANICVVGDDDQSIYQFRGSNADNMISFSGRYPDVHTIHLTKNFRSGEGIIRAADCVIRNNKERIEKQILPGDPDAAAHVQVICSEDGSQWDDIRQLVSDVHAGGVPYREIAVLVRKGKFIAPIVSALTCAGIPVSSNSAENFFTNPYVVQLGKTIQLFPSLNAAALSEIWTGYLDNTKITAGFRCLRRAVRDGHQRLTDIVQEFCTVTGLLDTDNTEALQRMTAIDGVRLILSDYEEIYGDWQLSARIDGVMKFLDRKVDEEYKYHDFSGSSNVDGVQVMTVHKSKGLEFNTVIIPKLENCEFPAACYGGRQYWHILGGCFAENKEKYQSDTEDERKLFYVAMTRAKQDLYLTYENGKHGVSPFILEAAEAPCVIIDRDKLKHQPKADTSYSFEEDSYDSIDDKRKQRAPEREQKHQYWEKVKYARGQLMDYYGTAGHFCPAAYGDLIRVESLSPDAILEEAAHLGLLR